MALLTVFDVRCCQCGVVFNWNDHYGRAACCCSRQCWDEFEKRVVLSLLGRRVPALGEKVDLATLEKGDPS